MASKKASERSKDSRVFWAFEAVRAKTLNSSAGVQTI